MATIEYSCGNEAAAAAAAVAFGNFMYLKLASFAHRKESLW